MMEVFKVLRDDGMMYFNITMETNIKQNQKKIVAY